MCNSVIILQTGNHLTHLKLVNIETFLTINWGYGETQSTANKPERHLSMRQLHSRECALTQTQSGWTTAMQSQYKVFELALTWMHYF